MPDLPRTEEKKRWYFVQKSFNQPYFAVLSKVFYAFDDKYLYERSGKRTPRESTFRTWYDSETSAVGTYYSQVGRWIKSHERELARYRRLEKGLGDKLNALIDAEHGGTTEPTDAE